MSNDVVEAARSWALALPETNPVRAAVLALVEVKAWVWHWPNNAYEGVAFDLDAALAAFPEPARNDMRLAYLELLGMAYGLWQPMSESSLLAAFGGVR